MTPKKTINKIRKPKQGLKMKLYSWTRFILLCGLTAMSISSSAHDIENNVTRLTDFGNWTLVEFGDIFGKHRFYKLAVVSENFDKDKYTFSFNIDPSSRCRPTNPDIVDLVGIENPLVNLRSAVLAYSLPGQGIDTEVTRVDHEQGDPFIFFVLEKLTVSRLLNVRGHGPLSIRIPFKGTSGGTGDVSSGDTVLFSLEGLNKAYGRAVKTCHDMPGYSVRNQAHRARAH